MTLRLQRLVPRSESGRTASTENERDGRLGRRVMLQRAIRCNLRDSD